MEDTPSNTDELYYIPDSEFESGFRFDEIETREQLKDNGGNSIERVTTPDYTAYIIQVDDGRKRKRIMERVQAAKRLGAHIPAVAYGDGEFAVKSFDGDELKYHTGNFNRDALYWTCAKLYLLGHSDLSPYENILTNRAGEFRVIDLQSFSVRSAVPGKIGHAVKALAYIDDLHKSTPAFEARLNALGDYVDETDVIDPVVTSEIQDNIDQVRYHDLFYPQDYLDKHHPVTVDETVIPPEEQTTQPPNTQQRFR